MMDTIGIVGFKLGMSRLFKEEGTSIPVTVIHAQPNRICQIKNKQKDGYDAVQLAVGEQKPQRVSKALRGHYAKSRVAIGRCLVEFRVTTEQAQHLSEKKQLDVSQFIEGQKVDLIGKSKGKGFSGAIKRWNFSSQDATHGNSISHRHLGSTGQCQFPGKVWKGKKMAGQYGNTRTTSMRLEVVAIDEEQNLLLIKGGVPGPEGGRIIIRPSYKQTKVEIERIEQLRKDKEAAQQAQQQEQEAAEAEKETAVSEDQAGEETKEAKGEKEVEEVKEAAVNEDQAVKEKEEVKEEEEKKEAKEEKAEKETKESSQAKEEVKEEEEKKEAKEEKAEKETKESSQAKEEAKEEGEEEVKEAKEGVKEAKEAKGEGEEELKEAKGAKEGEDLTKDKPDTQPKQQSSATDKEADPQQEEQTK